MGKCSENIKTWPGGYMSSLGEWLRMESEREGNRIENVK